MQSDDPCTFCGQPLGLDVDKATVVMFLIALNDKSVAGSQPPIGMSVHLVCWLRFSADDPADYDAKAH